MNTVHTGQHLKPVDLAAKALTRPAMLRQLGAALPPGTITPEKLARTVITSMRAAPAIADDLDGLMLGVLEAARLGLEVGTSATAQAHLIPMKTKRGPRTELWLSYRGLLALVRRSGEVSAVAAAVVKAGDHFEVEQGLEPKLIHRPRLDGPRGEITHAWGMIQMKDGAQQFEVLDRDELDRARAASRGSGDPRSPWNAWPETMYAKVALKRVLRLAPISASGLAEMGLQETVGGDLRGADEFDAIDITPAELVSDDERLPTHADIMSAINGAESAEALTAIMGEAGHLPEEHCEELAQAVELRAKHLDGDAKPKAKAKRADDAKPKPKAEI